LTAVVKLFLKRSEDAKDMVTTVLKAATSNIDNPDLRDRGYIYWRLLSTDPEAAATVVLCKRQPIVDDSHTIDDSVLDILLSNVATLASIYHKPPELFIKDGKATMVLKPSKSDRKNDSDSDDSSDESSSSDDDDDDDDNDDDDDDDNDDDAT